MSKKDRHQEKHQQKQQKAQQAARRKKRLPMLFGAIIVVIALIITASVLADKFDATAKANATLYSKEISLTALQEKTSAQEDFYAYFYQPSCQHCKVVSPYLIPLAQEMGKPLFPVNIEGKKDAWQDYHIEGTPTLIHFKDGKEVERLDGQYDPSVYSDFFKNAK